MSRLPVNKPRPTAAQIASGVGSNKVWPTVSDISAIAAGSIGETYYSPLVKDPGYSSGLGAPSGAITVNIPTSAIYFPDGKTSGKFRLWNRLSYGAGTAVTRTFTSTASFGGGAGIIACYTSSVIGAASISGFGTIEGSINDDGSYRLAACGQASPIANQAIQTGTLNIVDGFDITLTLAQTAGTAPTNWEYMYSIEWEPSREPY